MPPPEIYERLRDATPDEKRDIVLQLIEEHPEGQLELPACDEARADLDGIDLGGSTLQEQFEPAQLESAPWWHVDFQGVQLRNADFRGAQLWNANLTRGRLRHANFEGASLREANLQNALLADANLQGTRLENAGLQGASLKSADLRDAVLDDANLQGTSLEDANFHGASLRGAKLQEVDLTRACIANIRIYGAWLGKTRLEWEQIDGKIGEELDAERKQDAEKRALGYGEARRAYLALHKNFTDLGDHNAARQAYLKERRMEKQEAFYQAQVDLQARHFKPAIKKFWKATLDEIAELTCDYGESVVRVFVSLFLVYTLFTLIYRLTGGVLPVNASEPTQDFTDLARFSLGAMTTLGPVGLQPRNGVIELLAGLEALVGIGLTGLLGFVLGNRIRRL